MKTFRNKETRKFITKVEEKYNVHLSKEDKFQRDENIVIIDDDPSFFFFKENIVPTLKFLLKENFLNTVMVDMGAVKFMAKGADVMRPGIIHIDEGIEKGDFVSVVDETHEKPLAVGEALFSSEEIQGMNSGKVLNNIHHVGDEIWNYQR